MNKIEELLKQLENTIPSFEALNMVVSKATAGWHIEHVLLTLNGITNSLSQSNPNNYKRSFSFIRTVVFTMKKIPRGKAKTPKVVEPKGKIDQTSLQSHLAVTQNKIKELHSISSNKYFEHPIFGHLNLRQTIKFLEIHTNHHLAIIKDIINK